MRPRRHDEVEHITGSYVQIHYRCVSLNSVADIPTYLVITEKLAFSGSMLVGTEPEVLLLLLLCCKSN